MSSCNITGTKNVPFYTLRQFTLIPEVAIVSLGICKIDFNATVKNLKQNLCNFDLQINHNIKCVCSYSYLSLPNVVWRLIVFAPFLIIIIILLLSFFAT